MKSRMLFVFILFFSLNQIFLCQRIGEKFIHFLGFTLVKDSLESVRRRFGNANIVEKGEAGGYEASLNYYVPRDNIVISFISTELGGGIYIQEYHIRKVSSEIKSKIPTIKLLHTDTLSIGGLYIGMTIDKFKNIVGKENVSFKNKIASFMFESTETEIDSTNNSVVTDVVIGGKGIFRKSILSDLTVWMTCTN